MSHCLKWRSGAIEVASGLIAFNLLYGRLQRCLFLLYPHLVFSHFYLAFASVLSLSAAFLDVHGELGTTNTQHLSLFMFDLDNDGQFDFDPYSQGSGSLAILSAMQQMADSTDSPPLALVASPTDDIESQASSWKGKGVSRPMPIPPAPAADPHDLFDMNGATSSHNDRHFYSFSPFSPSSSITCASPIDQEDEPHQASSWKGKDIVPIGSPASMHDPHDIFDMSEAASSHAFPSFSSRFSPVFTSPIDSIEQPSTSMEHDDASGSTGKGKGKEKEQPPTLPPLTFSPTEFGYVHANWPSPTVTDTVAGPSSYGSRDTAGPSSYNSLAPLDLISVPAPPAPVLSTPTVSARPLSRRRSLPSLTATPNAKSKFRLKAHSSSLARRLLFRKYDGDACPTPPSSPTDGRDLDLGAGTCFAPWRNDSALALEYDYFPALKGRTNSSPFPVSALDLIPVSTADVFDPIPLFVPNYFDDVLPRELRVYIMVALISVHEADHARALRDGQWTVAKASSSRNKWVGRDKALRELVRFSRVSELTSLCSPFE
jgi:F-box/leucine-rich repeat protein 2/20